MRNILPAVASTALALSAAAMSAEKAIDDDRSGGLSQHYMVAKMNRSGVLDPDWHGGHGVVVKLQTPPHFRSISESVMDVRSGVINGVTKPFGLVGLNRNGTFNSVYSSVWKTPHVGVKDVEDAKVILGGQIGQTDRRELFVAGTVKSETDQPDGALIARLYVNQDPSARHFFGENGAVRLRPSQIEGDATALRVLGGYALSNNDLRLVLTVQTPRGDRAYVVALFANGMLDRSFGVNGVRALDTGGVDFKSAAIFRDHVQPHKDPDFLLWWSDTDGVVSRISVRKFDFATGEKTADFRDVEMVAELGAASKTFVSANSAKFSIVSVIQSREDSAYHVALFTKKGEPDLRFSGDGRRYFNRDHADSLVLEATALANDGKLYFVERSIPPQGNVLVISRRLTDENNQGALDAKFGLDAAVQIGSADLRTLDGAQLPKPAVLSASGIFVEELLNDEHNLVISGIAALP